MPEKCTKTVLIPAVIVVLLVLIVNTIKKFDLAKLLSVKDSSNSSNDDVGVDVDESLTLANPAVAYNVLQCGAYAAMALMIMRLKLFFVPQLCILASFLGNDKVRLDGVVAQSVERPTKGPAGSVQFYWRGFKTRPSLKVVGKIYPSRAIWLTARELSARIGNVAAKMD